jgi:fructose-1,6-bisphosphatase/inositol monophosphatase family enzyme
MIVDLEQVASVIAEIAETEIASRFGRLKKRDIGTKTGPNDYVTEADRAAEAALERALRDICPGARFVGEESAAAEPATLDALNGDGAFWIVDPLDGTRNFVQRKEEFATIVALVVDGEIRAGWIYAIPDKAFAMASLGDGAEWRGEKMGPPPENEGRLWGYRAIGNLLEPWKSEMVPRLRKRFTTKPARCSAYVYVHLLTGHADFALYSRCSPWDHAAGVLMLREIGGRAEYLDTGAPYAPVSTQGRPLLVAGRDDNWMRVRANIAGAT